MEKELLRNIIKIRKGKKAINVFSEPETGRKRYLQIEDLRHDLNLKYTDSIKLVEVNENDIIIAWDGANAGLVSFNKAGFIGSRLVRLRINKEFNNKIHPHYLGYFLKNQQDYIKSRTTGATIPHVDRLSLINLYVPIINFDEQLRIVAILNKVQSFLQKRRKSLQLLEDLLRATFLEMFGDPILNSKAWNNEVLGTLINSRLGKMLDKKKQTGQYLKPYLRNINVRWFEFNLSELSEMDFTEKEQKIFRLQRGDLLVCEGGDVGRAAIWNEENFECYFQKALHRVRVKKEKLNGYYLMYLFWFYSMYGGFNDYVNASTISHLTGVKLKSMKIPLPPVSLQNNFENRFLGIKEFQKKIEFLQKKLETLFQSLFQKAFQGDLDSDESQVFEEIIREMKATDFKGNNKRLHLLVDFLNSQKFETVESYEKASKILLELIENESPEIEQRYVGNEIILEVI